MGEINRKNYKSLSRSEFELVEFVVNNELKVFGSNDLMKGLDFESGKVYRTVSSLRQKDLIESPMRGRYILDIPSYNVSIYEAASGIYWPSYISFWSALSYHGLTDQLPKTIHVVNTNSSSELEFRDHKISFVNMRPGFMFGYQDYDGVMAEPEKAVIDSLHLPRYAGGIREIEKSFERKLDMDKLEEYARRTEMSSVKKRLKYLMERKGIDNSLEVSGSYTKLDPSRGEGRRDSKTLVEDNVYVKE